MNKIVKQKGNKGKKGCVVILLKLIPMMPNLKVYPNQLIEKNNTLG